MKLASPQTLALLLLVSLAGCSARGPLGRGLAPPTDGVTLAAGDVLLGIEGLDPRRDGESRIVRYRRSRLDGDVRIEARTLVTVPGQPLWVQGSSDGHWLAATVQYGGDVLTQLWRLRDGEAQPAWVSPGGCRSPSFDPEARFLVLACPPDGRQPSWLLRVGLPDLALLALVGERPRSAPVVGVEGDLYWAERTGSHTVVMRRPESGVPYVTHQLFDAVDSLHPRDDGVLVAAVRTAHGGLELLDLQPSGRVVPRTLPPQLGVGSPTRVTSNAQGDLLAIRCLRGDCAVVDAPQSGHGYPAMTVSGRPLALAEVPRRGAIHPRPEDLATAPATVLATHVSSDVAVLGVALGMRLDAAWAVLEDAGLQPWWEAVVGSRARPRAIGVGRGAGSWCVEFRADERGLIAAVDMRECAVSYVSPALRPLLDRKNLVDGAMTIARQYLGPGVSMEVGDGVGSPGESRSHPVRKTTLQYDAPERGYHYRSETEVLESRSRRLWDGKVWLRLQPPGKRQAVRP